MLSFKNVNVSYHSDTILKNISLDVPSGRITTIIGPNGCGKTTLISSLNKTADLTDGSIVLEGTDLSKISSKERAKLIAFLPQIRQVIPAIPVKVLVEHGRFPHLGFSRRKTKEDTDIVNKAMDFTGVTKYSDMYVNTLSGGVRQRVFFAMILAQDCDTIILDEPTTYLDIEGQRNFYNMILSLKKQGKTIVIVSHDVEFCAEYGDRCAMFFQGKIISESSIREMICTNRFYTTVSHKMAGELIEKAITKEEVVWSMTAGSITE